MRLTYCGNVHAALDVETWHQKLDAFAVPVRDAMRDDGHDFGLGAWWSDQLIRELADQRDRQRLIERLRELRLPVWTANVFPFGDFHKTTVKTDVYSPDWSQASRAEYTVRVAQLVADIAPPGEVAPLSTLPVGYGECDLSAAGDQLAMVARELESLVDSSGVDLVLAIEPEPFCILETVDATRAFIEDHVFAGRKDEELLRRRIGVCVDLCHLEVVQEDVTEAFRGLHAAGIRLPKIQVSSCLELRDTDELDQLLEFDEPRYLHQTVASDGTRALDLPDVAARRAEFENAEFIRTHFHVPVFWDTEEALGSTQAQVRRVMRELPEPAPLLEVETYTWGVLGDSFGELTDGLVRELRAVRAMVETEA